MLNVVHHPAYVVQARTVRTISAETPICGYLLMTMLRMGVSTVMTLQINITPNGRMSLPADVRKRLGLTDGGAVYLDETEDGVVLRTANQAVARAQALAKQYTDGNPDASVDAFLSRRREDSGE
jgi:AbrB family looped-hinge helix DNA binding protein